MPNQEIHENKLNKIIIVYHEGARSTLNESVKTGATADTN